MSWKRLGCWCLLDWYIFCLQLLATATWMMHSWTDMTFWTSRVEASFTIIKSSFTDIFFVEILVHSCTFRKWLVFFLFFARIASTQWNPRVQSKMMWRFSMFLRSCWKNRRNQSNPTNPTNPGHSDLLRDLQISLNLWSHGGQGTTKTCHRKFVEANPDLFFFE